ncbi:ATP-binding protein [Lentzea sp. NBC_00516]|uniref:ATP-binding protein n=1 Tax=Lentzea sp. NBC_00516 TaxID=2903582 RepID=UPI002E81F702|nr:ATP-binding protein [Lentzea sp. NBC_00516]WUD26480.1 ATP-binding protein [Lentzea sp. NBC_00516]
MDVEILDHRLQLLAGKQYKVRRDGYSWGQAELVAVMRRWAAVPGAESAVFEFVTDGVLGPSGERVRDALTEASSGDFKDLAAIIGVSDDDAVIRRMARASVRRDPVGVGPLLLHVELQVMSMLPAVVTVADARHLAETGVNRLFILLMERAGNPDPQRRLISRAEIAAALGVASDQAPSQRWPGQARGRYLSRASALTFNMVTPQLLKDAGVDGAAGRASVFRDAGRLSVISMVEQVPSLLAGPTGAGKSTACHVLIRDAANADQTVLLAHAEAYLPGRLAALAADALSEVLDEPMPLSTGVQLLADPAVALVIDGVSEIPPALRDAMAEDLRVLVASGRGAGVVVVGRDAVALRAVLPNSRKSTRFAVVALDHKHRIDAAQRLLAGELLSNQQASSMDARTLTARADHALGDAAGNPLLFTMAAQLIYRGVSFKDRSGMYAAFVERLAERSGVEGIPEVERVLGVAFARLLNEGRRYSNPYEWRKLIGEAAQEFDADASRADHAARRAGLIVSVGYSQTVMPMHDSFADFFAGAAHAARLIPYPIKLSQADEQRVVFAAQIGGVDAELAAAVVRDLPMAAVAVADYDTRGLEESAPAETANLLAVLVRSDALPIVSFWRYQDGVVAFLRNNGESGWVNDDEAQELAKYSPSVTGRGGPLDLAVRLWRRHLRLRLTPMDGAPIGRPRTSAQAVDALRLHATSTAAEIEKLLRILPVSARAAVAIQVGPFGMTARIDRHQQESFGSMEWIVTFGHSEEIDIAEIDDESDRVDRLGTTGSVQHVLSVPSQTRAAARIREAINKIVDRDWL